MITQSGDVTAPSETSFRLPHQGCSATNRISCRDATTLKIIPILLRPRRDVCLWLCLCYIQDVQMWGFFRPHFPDYANRRGKQRAWRSAFPGKSRENFSRSLIPCFCSTYLCAYIFKQILRHASSAENRRRCIYFSALSCKWLFNKNIVVVSVVQVNNVHAPLPR